MKRFICPLLACLLLLTQCKPEEQKVSKEEAEKFVAEMEKGAVKRQSNLVTSHIVTQALAARMAKEKNIKNMGGIEKGMEKELNNSELDKNIYATIGKNGSFEKVKVYEKDGKQRVIFRAFGDQGLNYFDMELTKLENKIGIADMFIYTSGENISKSMADLIVGLSDGLSESRADQTVRSFQRVKQLMAQENFERAKEEFDRLPGFIKETRIADILNIQISSRLGEAAYMKEIERFEKKYSAEPNVQLTMIDIYFLRKDYDKALNAVNSVDSMINKDGFLNYYRGLLSNVKGEVDKAIEYYKKVTESNPSFPGAYQQLTLHYISKEDKENAKLYFSKYKQLRDVDGSSINEFETAYPFLKE